jgi:hypothetical protein
MIISLKNTSRLKFENFEFLKNIIIHSHSVLRSKKETNFIRFIKKSISNDETKFLNIEYDDKGQLKYSYLNFDKVSNLSKIDKKVKPDTTNNVIKNPVSKVKFFGSENEEFSDSGLPNSAKSANSGLDEFFIENKPVTLANNKEEINENLINYQQFFSDYTRLYIKAGDGGNGLLSFIKGPLFADRTPQGGDGGNGGDVIFVADETVSSLSKIRKAHFYGNPGEKGQTKSMGGKNGKDLEIRVPVGTIVHEILRNEDFKFKKKELRSDRNYQTKKLIDLNENGMRYVICQGGRKGIGNTTKRNLTPDSKSQKGQPGEEKEIELVLKCLSDVGLIGFPNAGKSTLLAAVS